MGFDFLTVNSAGERYVANAERVYRGWEEEVDRVGDECEGNGNDERVEDPWLPQLGWILKKTGKLRSVVSSAFFVVIFFFFFFAQATLFKVQEPDEPEYNGVPLKF